MIEISKGEKPKDPATTKDYIIGLSIGIPLGVLFLYVGLQLACGLALFIDIIK